MSERKTYRLLCGCVVDKKSEHLTECCATHEAEWQDAHTRAADDRVRLEAEHEGI